MSEDRFIKILKLIAGLTQALGILAILMGFPLTIIRGKPIMDYLGVDLGATILGIFAIWLGRVTDDE